MSASLVGSEMCIRDRPRYVAVPGVRRPPCARRPPAGRPLRRKAGLDPLGGCLLYTSDAADDM
eukprot:8746310-Alexandrium_andersonii.AAC.1